MMAPMPPLLGRQESGVRAAQSSSFTFFACACTWCLNRWQMQSFREAELHLGFPYCNKRSLGVIGTTCWGH